MSGPIVATVIDPQPAYATDADFRAYIRDTSTLDADSIHDILYTASRDVDAYCGRSFYQATLTQYFSPEGNDLWILNLDDQDLASTVGLTVSSQWSNTANYNIAWTLNVDYIAEPVNQSSAGLAEWPFTKLRALGTKNWPPRYASFYRDTVKIVGTWGWPSVPDPVVRATLARAHELWKMQDALPGGTIGLNGFGPVRLKGPNTLFTTLLSHYRRGSASTVRVG